MKKCQNMDCLHWFGLNLPLRGDINKHAHMWVNSRILPLHRDQSFSNTGRMPLKIIRAVSNIAISKTYIDHENPDSRVVTASEKYILLTISRSYNGILCLPAPSTAFRKGGLVFTSGCWSTKTGRGCTRYMSEKGVRWNTNKSISMGDSGREDFWWLKHWQTILIAVRKCKCPKTPSIKRLVQLCKVKIAQLITYTS